MSTEGYDFVFQLHEEVLDKVAKASFYADVYPHYFDYSDADYRNRYGGSSRYIFLAPPSIAVESTKPSLDYLKVTFPFHMERLDNAGLVIGGKLLVEVRLVKVIESGTFTQVDLDFGNISFASIDSDALKEAAEKIEGNPSWGAMLLILGSAALDSEGNIDLEKFVRDMLLDFVTKKVGKIDVTPAIQAVNRIGIGFADAELKVLDVPSVPPSDAQDALCLMLNFAGNAGKGNLAALGSFLKEGNDFGIAVQGRLVQALLDQEVANGNVPTSFTDWGPFPVKMSGLKVELLDGKLELSCNFSTKVRVRVWFIVLKSTVSGNLNVDIFAAINGDGNPQVSILNTKVSGVKGSGALGVLANLFSTANLSRLVKAPLQEFFQTLMSRIGVLKATWPLPSPLPFQMKVEATQLRLDAGAVSLVGRVGLLGKDGNPYEVDGTYIYPPLPVSVVYFRGDLQRIRSLIRTNDEQFFRGSRTFGIEIPMPGSGMAIPAIYYLLPELKSLILQGVVGHVEFRVTYRLPWTRHRKVYQYRYHGHYTAFWQFLGPEVTTFEWKLEPVDSSNGQTGWDLKGEDRELDIDIVRSIAGEETFSQVLQLTVTDNFGVTVSASKTLSGNFVETEVVETPPASESSVRNRELLLEQIQNVSDALSGLQNTRDVGVEGTAIQKSGHLVEIIGDESMGHGGFDSSLKWSGMSVIDGQ